MCGTTTFWRDRATEERAKKMLESAINMMAEEADFHLSQDFDATNLEFRDGSQCPQTTDEPSNQPTSTSRGGKKCGRANEGAVKALNDIAKSIGSFVSKTRTRMEKIANALHVAQGVRSSRMSLEEEL